MIKKTLIALSISSLLSACGGSSADKPETPVAITPDTTPAVAAEFRVIDGYLSNASVCVIAEGARYCVEVGTTDENGLITLPVDITSGQVVATITAGQTQDADRVGFVGNSYQLVANISAETPNVITPFTTLDVLDTTKSMTDIAAELNLPESLLNSDYVTSDDAHKAHVHALARAVVTELDVDKASNDVAALFTKTSIINDYINESLANQ